MESESHEKTRRTTIYLPEDLHAELRIEAIRQRISMTKLIIRAIKQELKQGSQVAKKRRQ